MFKDLKPDNILIQSLDLQEAINVQLTDFGSAEFSGPAGLIDLACCTPGYRAPEMSPGNTFSFPVGGSDLGYIMHEWQISHDDVTPHSTSLYALLMSPKEVY